MQTPLFDSYENLGNFRAKNNEVTEQNKERKIFLKEMQGKEKTEKQVRKCC